MSKLFKAGLPLPRTTKIGKPGFSEFLISPSRISKNPRTPRSEDRITLQTRSRRHQIRSEPPIRMHNWILPQTTPPPTDSFFTTMYNHPVLTLVVGGCLGGLLMLGVIVLGCSRWRPVALSLHRFFIAIARAVVNHDGEAGTSMDPMV